MRAHQWIGLALAAAVTGAVLARPVIGWTLDRTALRNGPWRTSLTTGAAAANPYERAAVAIAGLYALAREETVYYTAFEDSGGRTLDARCEYELAGRPLPARWWSVTMYGADHYLVDNAAGIYSRHAANLAAAGDGSYVVAISPRPQPANWLPAPAQGAFSVTLRLYNPGREVYDRPQTVALPEIRRKDCR